MTSVSSFPVLSFYVGVICKYLTSCSFLKIVPVIPCTREMLKCHCKEFSQNLLSAFNVDNALGISKSQPK